MLLRPKTQSPLWITLATLVPTSAYRGDKVSHIALTPTSVLGRRWGDSWSKIAARMQKQLLDVLYFLSVVDRAYAHLGQRGRSVYSYPLATRHWFFVFSLRFSVYFSRLKDDQREYDCIGKQLEKTEKWSEKVKNQRRTPLHIQIIVCDISRYIRIIVIICLQSVHSDAISTCIIDRTHIIARLCCLWSHNFVNDLHSICSFIHSKQEATLVRLE